VNPPGQLLAHKRVGVVLLWTLAISCTERPGENRERKQWSLTHSGRVSSFPSLLDQLPSRPYPNNVQLEEREHSAL
ncbi:hypothetical protein JZ751_012358, partial [Albula glossodonta]